LSNSLKGKKPRLLKPKGTSIRRRDGISPRQWGPRRTLFSALRKKLQMTAGQAAGVSWKANRRRSKKGEKRKRASSSRTWEEKGVEHQISRGVQPTREDDAF